MEKVNGRELTVAKRGRGRRGTQAVAHNAGARVDVGTTFRRVVAVPSFRARVDEPEGRSRIRRRWGRREAVSVSAWWGGKGAGGRASR